MEKNKILDENDFSKLYPTTALIVVLQVHLIMDYVIMVQVNG